MVGGNVDNGGRLARIILCNRAAYALSQVSLLKRRKILCLSRHLVGDLVQCGVGAPRYIRQRCVYASP